MELNSGVRGCETPFHAHAALVPLLLAGPGHPLHLLLALDSDPQVACRARTLSSISAMFSQLPSFGV